MKHLKILNPPSQSNRKLSVEDSKSFMLDLSTFTGADTFDIILLNKIKLR